MKMQLSSGVVFAILFYTGKAVEALRFPDAYYAAGTLYLPYGDIVEPFEAWVDMKSGNSRLDTYGGTAKIINQKQEGSDGTMYKIVPMTTDNVTNQITCFKVEGHPDSPVVPQGVVPNAALYQFATEIEYNGVECSVYISYFSHGNKVNNYTLLVRKDNAKPVALHFIGFDRLFGSHYDEYDIVYTDFVSSAPDPSVFDYQKRYQCVGFPGPGIEDPMSENPFFEFVGASSYSHSDQRKRASAEFESFSRIHGKKYKDDVELTHRMAIFNHNLRYITSVNRRNLSYKLAVNHMADYSDKEFRMLRGVIKTKDSPRHNVYVPSNKDVPSSWNWRLRGIVEKAQETSSSTGAVTPVKDQGICGSCWSFGTTGTLEGSYFIKHGNLVSLSEQSLVDCSWGYGNNGCDGGESERSYKWIMKNGCIPTEFTYGQYLMQDGLCHVDQAVCGVRISNWYNTPQGDVQALVQAVYEHGPISIAIDASHLSFSFYSHGVYFEPQCGNTPDDLDHQVLAVGYGSLDGTPYILVKNSWSTHWGNAGYILMSQKDNNCGIATDASYADVL